MAIPRMSWAGPGGADVTAFKAAVLPKDPTAAPSSRRLDEVPSVTVNGLSQALGPLVTKTFVYQSAPVTVSRVFQDNALLGYDIQLGDTRMKLKLMDSGAGVLTVEGTAANEAQTKKFIEFVEAAFNSVIPSGP